MSYKPTPREFESLQLPDGVLSGSMCVKMIMVMWIIHVGDLGRACDQSTADKALRNDREYSLRNALQSRMCCRLFRRQTDSFVHFVF